MVRPPRPRLLAWRPALLAATLVGAGALGGAALTARSHDRVSDVVAARLTDRVATCVFGDAAVARDGGGGADAQEASVLLAVRRAELASMGLPSGRQLESAAARWPARCAPDARALADEELARGAAGRARAAARLAAALEMPGSGTGAAEWTSALLTWLADVRSAARTLAVAPGVALPPELPPGSVATVDSLEPASLLLHGTAPLSGVHFDRAFDESGDAATAFVLDRVASASASPGAAERQPDGATYCVYAGGEARCSRLRGAAASAGDVVPGGPALVVAGDAGTRGIFDVDGGGQVPVSPEGGVYGASVGGGGLDLVTTGPLPPEVRLVHVEGRGDSAKATETPLFSRKQVGDPSFNVGLFWGFLVSKRVTTDRMGLRLRVRPVNGKDVGPETDVGQVGEAAALEASGAEPHLQACRTREAIALRARGWDAEYFSFYRDGTWSRPVELEGAGGAMTCHGGEVTLLDERGHVEAHRYEPVITESRCSAAACRKRTLQTREIFGGDAEIMPEEPRDLRVAAIGDALCLLWRGGGATGSAGLRMRLGKLEQLAKRDDVVLFDDHVEGGRVKQDSTLLDFAVRAVPGGALVMLATTAGTFLYRIDGGGRFLPVPVRLP